MEELHAPTLPHLDLRRIRQQQQDDKPTSSNGKKLRALLDRDFFYFVFDFWGMCVRACLAIPYPVHSMWARRKGSDGHRDYYNSGVKVNSLLVFWENVFIIGKEVPPISIVIP